jgi:hypothetical protein
MRARKESWGETPHHVLQTPAFVQNTPQNLTECAFCGDSAIAVGTSHCAPNTQPAVWVAFGRGKNAAFFRNCMFEAGKLTFWGEPTDWFSGGQGATRLRGIGWCNHHVTPNIVKHSSLDS